LEPGEKVTKPTDPTLAGKVFVTWHDAETLDSEYDFDTPVISDLTLYAEWDDEDDD
jgi:uncharacterized repeat protein (TIGR02543 family)